MEIDHDEPSIVSGLCLQYTSNMSEIASTSKPAITCDKLVKHYTGWLSSRVEALRGLSLEVPKGYIYGLLGPNGAGKTTFIKSLLGLVTITGGSASILNTSVPSSEVLKHIGYLPENHQLPAHLTGKQVVHYYGKLNDVPSDTRRKRCEKYLKEVKMWERRHDKVKTYSKGMKQRVGLAQAMINDPRILFLDEPTDGVDPVGRKLIRDLLEKMVDQEDKTIFINSHILTELELICDRVAILKEGKLIREGPLDELRGKGITYRVQPAGSIPDDARETIQSRWDWIETPEHPEGFEVGMSSESDIDELQEVLWEHDVRFREFLRKEQSLEDFFIDVVTDEEA